MVSDPSEPRRVAVRQSLVRPLLLVGGERRATVINFAIAIVIVLITRSLIGILVAVFLAGLVQAMLKVLAKKDPQSLETVSRHLKYQHFYPAASSLAAEPSRPRHEERVSPVSLILAKFVK